MTVVTAVAKKAVRSRSSPLFCAGVVFVDDVVLRVPGPERDAQQHACEEHQRQTEDVQSVESPVVTEVGKTHAEDHGDEVADRDDGIDRGLEEWLHLEQAVIMYTSMATIAMAME
jgi:hypothetical protein